MRRALLLAAVLSLLIATGARAWTWPTGGSVLRTFQFDPATPYAAGQHRGIDVGGSPGEPVLAPAGGTISFAGSPPWVRDNTLAEPAPAVNARPAVRRTAAFAVESTRAR